MQNKTKASHPSPSHTATSIIVYHHLYVTTSTHHQLLPTTATVPPFAGYYPLSQFQSWFKKTAKASVLRRASRRNGGKRI
ncbi:hypothetical protein Hdeb2414_s0013g00409001 [Helianthus debilis subsp. tardiflorus]